MHQAGRGVKVPAEETGLQTFCLELIMQITDGMFDHLDLHIGRVYFHMCAL